MPVTAQKQSTQLIANTHRDSHKALLSVQTSIFCVHNSLSSLHRCDLITTCSCMHINVSMCSSVHSSLACGVSKHEDYLLVFHYHWHKPQCTLALYHRAFNSSDTINKLMHDTRHFPHKPSYPTTPLTMLPNHFN